MLNKNYCLAILLNFPFLTVFSQELNIDQIENILEEKFPLNIAKKIVSQIQANESAGDSILILEKKKTINHFIENTLTQEFFDKSIGQYYLENLTFYPSVGLQVMAADHNVMTFKTLGKDVFSIILGKLFIEDVFSISLVEQWTKNYFVAHANQNVKNHLHLYQEKIKGYDEIEKKYFKNKFGTIVNLNALEIFHDCFFNFLSQWKKKEFTNIVNVVPKEIRKEAIKKLVRKIVLVIYIYTKGAEFSQSQNHKRIQEKMSFVRENDVSFKKYFKKTAQQKFNEYWVKKYDIPAKEDDLTIYYFWKAQLQTNVNQFWGNFSHFVFNDTRFLNQTPSTLRLWKTIMTKISQNSFLNAGQVELIEMENIFAGIFKTFIPKKKINKACRDIEKGQINNRNRLLLPTCELECYQYIVMNSQEFIEEIIMVIEKKFTESPLTKLTYGDPRNNNALKRFKSTFDQACGDLTTNPGLQKQMLKTFKLVEDLLFYCDQISSIQD